MMMMMMMMMFITPEGTKPRGPYTALPNQYIHLKQNSQKPIQITFEYMTITISYQLPYIPDSRGD